MGPNPFGESAHVMLPRGALPSLSWVRRSRVADPTRAIYLSAKVVVASPRPAAATVAAAHVSGADALLCVGGAQAVAAMAFG